MYYYNWNNQNQNPYVDQDWQNWYRKITIVEAMNIALERVPGEVVKVELEREHGREVYEVEIVSHHHHGVKYEVKVDAHTGRIISVKVD